MWIPTEPINLWSYRKYFMSKLEPKDTVETDNFMGFTNKNCEFYPCHNVDNVDKEFNCLFCYCPLAWLECKGDYTVIETNGVKRKDCSACNYNHNGIESSWKWVTAQLKEPKTVKL